jgi:hypothetical protein|tara:strand:- start:127 stop:591 length:465 start_codon:yes stop_codon:yes gene_type:complete
LNLSIQKEKVKAMEKGGAQREIGQNKATLTEGEKEENARRQKVEQYIKRMEGAGSMNASRLLGKPGQGAKGGFLDMIAQQEKARQLQEIFKTLQKQKEAAGGEPAGQEPQPAASAQDSTQKKKKKKNKKKATDPEEAEAEPIIQETGHLPMNKQ